MSDFAALFSLLVSAFMSATFLPGSSELVLVGLIARGGASVLLLVLVASVGNVAGAVINWALGRGIERFKDRRWFPASPDKLERAKGWYRRWGRWSLLLSWVPLFGDGLTVAAGVMREPLWSFMPLVALAKTARYAVVAAGAVALT